MMRTRRGGIGALVGALALWAAPALAQVTINVDMNVAPANGMAVVNVTMAAGDATVGGMQNDIIFDSTIVNLAQASACRINSAIGLFPSGMDCTVDATVGPCKNLNSVIQSCPGGDGCPDGAGANIKVFRGIIAATAAPNNNPIPSGTLYTCTFTVVNAAALPATLTNDNVVVSDPVGTRLDSSGTSGSIGEGGPVPTDTPGGEPTNTPTVPPTPPPGGALISIGSADPMTNPTVTIEVSMTTDDASVGGMQNDIIFDSAIVNLAMASACRINPAIGLFPSGMDCTVDASVGPCKNLNSVIQNCPGGDGCPDGASATTKVFRAIIAATAAPNNNPIPDGLLYTCNFTVVSAAGLPTALTGENVVVSDPVGTRLESVISSGSIGPVGPPPATATPTNTGVTPPTPTNTSVTPPTPTNTSVVSPTTGATATATEETPDECSSALAAATTATDVAITLVNGDCFPTGGGTIQLGTSTVRGYTERVSNQLFLTQPVGSIFPAGTVVTLLRGGGDDDDGCHINAKATSSHGWLLLIPALALLALRRRRW